MKKLIFLIISLFFLFSCTSSNNLDVINPNADYIYFYGKTCSHCIKVNEYFVENDIMNKYSIEKREVWNNTENAKIFKTNIERLWLVPEETGVPFVIRKKDDKYFIWDVDIIKLFDSNIVD